MARAAAASRPAPPGLKSAELALSLSHTAAYIYVRSNAANTMMAIDEIIENFELLDEWDDRYRYLIELGRSLPELPESARIEANKVRGCASQVWDIPKKTQRMRLTPVIRGRPAAIWSKVSPGCSASTSPSSPRRQRSVYGGLAVHCPHLAGGGGCRRQSAGTCP